MWFDTVLEKGIKPQMTSLTAEGFKVSNNENVRVRTIEVKYPSLCFAIAVFVITKLDFHFSSLIMHFCNYVMCLGLKKATQT